MIDPAFVPSKEELASALDPVLEAPGRLDISTLPSVLPEDGVGARAALAALAPVVLGGAQRLGAPEALAHMDPPTPWISWATALWNASVNQNLLHPDVAPVARDLEARVIDWIAPNFGMDGGHMTPGSTVSNLTALWAAREIKGVTTVLASEGAHLSAAKAAHILGLSFRKIIVTASGALDPADLPNDMSDCALVLTAGATSTGAIDPLSLAGKAAWTHVDAAWSGPLRFSQRYGGVLDGIENADSIAISAHKWFFQPKESGLVLFKDTDTAHKAVSFGGAYLALPNVGVLGSHGAMAVPLLATLMAWGKTGLQQRIDHTMDIADRLYNALKRDDRVTVFSAPQSGVMLWRPVAGRPVAGSASELRARLPEGMSSLTTVDGQDWLRQVAANPMADVDRIITEIGTALDT